MAGTITKIATTKITAIKITNTKITASLTIGRGSNNDATLVCSTWAAEKRTRPYAFTKPPGRD